MFFGVNGIKDEGTRKKAIFLSRIKVINRIVYFIRKYTIGSWLLVVDGKRDI